VLGLYQLPPIAIHDELSETVPPTANAFSESPKIERDEIANIDKIDNIFRISVYSFTILKILF
jgi:hypothetical protein